MAASFFYDTTVDKRIECGDWDYLFANLNLQQNPSLPKLYRCEWWWNLASRVLCD